MMLRACERFGMDPRAIDDLRPGMWTLLIDYETVRIAEEFAVEKAKVGA